MAETDPRTPASDDAFFASLGGALDDLETVTAALRTAAVAAGDGMARIRDVCAGLQHAAYWVRQPLIDLTLRRLNNYIHDLSEPSEYQIDDIDAFFDVIRGILAGEVDKDTDAAEFVRSLPARRPVDIEDIAHLHVEILIVDPAPDSLRRIESELVSCGYRVAFARGFFEALELAVRTRPDLIVASAALDELGGIELGRAIRAITPTEHIPFALLALDDVDLQAADRLPGNAAVLRHGDRFGDDLAEALHRFRIT